MTEFHSDGEVLIALLKDKSDFAILQEQGWYRIPVEHKPKRWPPEYLAFYQGRAFGNDAFRIRYFGKVKSINTVERKLLFPNEFDSSKSKKLYLKIHVDRLEPSPRPIPTKLPRRIVFISSTWEKFIHAYELNDLFDESPLEDDLWAAFKAAQVTAQRQWEIEIRKHYYQLDFAVFCVKGQIDVEADGDTWHSERKRIDKDNNRNNILASDGWSVLRFNGKQIKENSARYCLNQIEEAINKFGGLKDDGIVPRKFHSGESEAQQLSLFEERSEDDID